MRRRNIAVGPCSFRFCCCHEDLIPEPWTNERLVGLMTAMTILFAGMATALNDRDAALAVLQSAASHVPAATLVRLCSAWLPIQITLSLRLTVTNLALSGKSRD